MIYDISNTKLTLKINKGTLAVINNNDGKPSLSFPDEFKQYVVIKNTSWH
jgi:hypothetical protein